MPVDKIADILGDKADYLLNHTSSTVDRSLLHLPSPNYVEDTWLSSNRNNQVLRSFQAILNHGRLAATRRILLLLTVKFGSS